MRRNLLLLIIITLCIPLFGDPVDENTAKQLAQNFWKENNIMGVKGDKVFKKRMDNARFVNIAPQCGYSEFFIFNNEDGKGFVIIAADDCVTPILGYSYDNNFAYENLPPNLKSWLDGYAEQIQAAVEMRVYATEEIRTEWNCLRQGKNLPIRSETEVGPLISTRWGQGDYYNAQCPSLLGIVHTPTGCVATAMAQIMKFWNYPSHGYNYHSYECWPYGTQSANFASTEYHWASMPNIVTSPNDAVATLMYHCGVSVEMNYGVQSSGAFLIHNDYGGNNTFCAENALKDYFGYSQSLQGIKKNDYTESEWINLLKTELNNYRPILYGGQGTGGHAFICDGYDNYNRFSFNWGWDGQSNGYFFFINNINPPNGGELENFSNYQSAVIGIQPDDNLQSFDLVLYDDVQMVGDNYGNYSFDQNISAYAEILNNGNSIFEGYIAAAVFDNDNYFIDFLGGGAATIEPNYWTSGTVTHEGGIPFLPSYDYLYHVVMFYSTDGQYWSMVRPGNYSNDAVFQVFNNGVTLETNSPITFSNGEENVLFNGHDISFNVDIINQGSTPFNNDVWIALLDADENYVQIIDDFIASIPVNGSITVNFSGNITAPIGEYYLALIYYEPDFSAHYVGSVFYPSIKRVYVINLPHTIAATSNPSNGGTITGQGSYLEGETCTLTSTANNGYAFVNWTEDGTQVSTSATYTFTVTGDRNLVAHFQQQQQQYTISISANPTNGGYVSISGELSYDFENGFSGWTSIDADGDGFNWMLGSVLMEGYVINAHNGEDMVCSQSYDIDEGALTPDNYLVSPQIQLGGSISFWACAQDNAYPSEHFGVAVSTTSNTNANSFTTIQEWTMTAKSGGRFSNHSRDGNSRGQGNWYQYTVDLSAYSGQTGYIAIRHFNCSDMFYLDVDDVTIHTIGDNTYYQGQVCTVHATPNDGYTFVNWTENGTQVSTNANYTFTVTDNRNLVANFQQQQQQYTISVSANPSNGGSVSGGGTFNQGASCTVHATANSGYTFVNWSENGTQVSTNANYTFTVTGNHSLVAHFQQQQQQYTISVSANPSYGGSVSGGGTFNQEASCTVHATANSGYSFVNWTENGTQVSTNANYTFTVTGNRSLVAHFQQQQQQYTISVSANPSNGGSVSGGGTFNQGASCTVHAAANSGYTFVNWTENGTQVSTNANYTFTVTGNRNLVANFAQSTHTIQATAGANGIITPSGTVTVTHGSNQSFAMVPDTGYEVQEVYIDGNPVGPMHSYTFTNVSANHYIHVTFVHMDGTGENNMSITVYPNPTKDKVTIECQDLSHVRIVNTFGQTVYNADHEGEQAVIDLSQMAKGIYMMYIEAEGGQTVRKIVVE